MRTILMALVTLLIMSCGSREILLRPQGSQAQVSLLDGKVETAELLALQDSILMCATDTLLEIPLSNVGSLKLDIDEARGWVLPVVILQGLTSVVLLATVEDKQVGAIGLLVTAVTWAAFEFSGPHVRFQQPLTSEDIEVLHLHMRYPQGLTNEQIANLRQSFAIKKR